MKFANNSFSNVDGQLMSDNGQIGAIKGLKVVVVVYQGILVEISSV